MNVTRWAIEKNRVTLLALAVVLIGGVTAYYRLPRNFDPGFIIRVAQVVTYFPGAGPDRVEQLVTDKLEKAIQEMPELDFIKSESKTGVSVILVNIKTRYKAMRPIWDKLRRKVDKARAGLPDGVIGPFVDDEFGDVYGVIIALTGDGFSYAELKEAADAVRDELLRIQDVAKVEIIGSQEERVFVEYNNARLAELGISPYQLMQILQTRNIIIPGGSVRVGPERIVLEPSGNFDSLKDLSRTVINSPVTGQVLFLGDIVQIRRGTVDPPHALMRHSGQPCLGLAVSMRDGGNLIRMGNDITALMDRLQGLYPHGLDFHIVNFQPTEVNDKVNDFVVNLGQSIFVVVAVMLVTLGIRTGMLVATLIPATMLMSLFVMLFFGIGMDQVSLASLIIALGMLVDNAIVICESIQVQIREGKKALDAAVDSAGELAVPLLTSSLTTSAAFLPIFLAKSDTGEYTAPLFKVVTITPAFLVGSLPDRHPAVVRPVFKSRSPGKRQNVHGIPGLPVFSGSSPALPAGDPGPGPGDFLRSDLVFPVPSGDLFPTVGPGVFPGGTGNALRICHRDHQRGRGGDRPVHG